jgi:hypothetical protein
VIGDEEEKYPGEQDWITVKEEQVATPRLH